MTRTIIVSKEHMEDQFEEMLDRLSMINGDEYLDSWVFDGRRFIMEIDDNEVK